MPEFVGPYRIAEVAGRGGMGIVYRAREEWPDREVAVKVIRPHRVSAAILDRFAKEIDFLAKLQHPGIARVYSAGTFAGSLGDQPYYAMEWIDGESITRHCKDRPLRDRVQLMRRVCQALSHAHRRRVVHRDLKPADILIDASGQPRVLDFGVARWLQAEGSHAEGSDAKESADGMIGTLAYASPEQLERRENEIDGRSDVYALGLILYEMLTGKRPYAVPRGDLQEAVDAVRTAEPIPVGVLVPEAQGDLSAVVDRALRKDPEERYRSAGALEAELGRFLQGVPVQARPEGRVDRWRRILRRNRKSAAGVAALLVLVIAGTSVASWQWQRARTAQDLIERSESRLLQAWDLLVSNDHEWPDTPRVNEIREANRAAYRSEFEKLARDFPEVDAYRNRLATHPPQRQK